MPLVAHNNLPSFDRLREQGYDVLSAGSSLSLDPRELHVGVLNMMPDAALEITERQFLSLIANCSQPAQFYAHFFSVGCLPRSGAAQAHIDEHYTTFEQLRETRLDALIISGANVSNPALDEEPFWNPLREIIDWAQENVHSILCSCLATHALVKQLYGIDRRPLRHKKWGVFSHRATNRRHPLLQGINTRFDVPHSRFNEITREQLETAGLHILAESDEAGVHLAVSPDQSRLVFFQGHPEYDHNSLLKEYKREINRYLAGEIGERPPYPDNYFSSHAAELVESFMDQATRARARGDSMPAFPEGEMEPHLDNTWGDTGKALFSNWIGLVCRLAHSERCMPFMQGVGREVAFGMRDCAS
ncbi:MAG: homoserine O-succinyltransferase [Gammaproteobacteria bacterium]|nr:homoserine O-succinyltransferase [Gammaproteobacteria bacterium]